MVHFPHVVIIGSGAVGGFYSAILKRAGCKVSMVLRSDYDTVAENGVVVDSPLGDLSFQPDHIYHGNTRAQQENIVPDYVLLCVKVVPKADRVALVRPWLGTSTRLVLIENGIDIEPELQRAYPDNLLISCSAIVAASRVAPGHIKHSAYGQLVMGLFPEGVDGSCRDLATLFKSGGVDVQLTESIVEQRWKKCVWNTALNPLAALANGADTKTLLGTQDGESLIRELMKEVCIVAAADGFPLPADKLMDKSIESTRNMPGFRNSITQDYLNGRPLELDAIPGPVAVLYDGAVRNGNRP